MDENCRKLQQCTNPMYASCAGPFGVQTEQCVQRATEGVLGVQGRSGGPGGGAARGEAPSGILIDARKAIKISLLQN